MPNSDQLQLSGQKTAISPLLVGNNTLKANNCVIQEKNIIKRRLGWNFYGNVFNLLSKKFNKLLIFKDRLLVQYANSIAQDSDGSGTFTDYPFTYNPPAGMKMQYVNASKSLYFTSAEGIRKLGSLNGTISFAGVPKAIDFAVTDAGGTYGSPLQNNLRYAYRVLWGIVDENEFTNLGAPSMRVIYLTVNTNATSLKVQIPNDITTSYFLQVHRSFASASSSTDPDDELSLVFEGKPNSTDITNGYMTVVDAQPESLLGAALYTSPSQEGIAQSNYLPPIAKDIATFKDAVFYSNTQKGHSLTTTFISSDIANGETFQINFGVSTVTFTARAIENLVNLEFAIGTGTVAGIIDSTARSLVHVINQGTWPTIPHVYAYYLSGFDDLPGRIFLEVREPSYVSFWLTAGTTAMGNRFRPVIPTSGNSVISTAEIVKNRTYISKRFQPEAVPILNYIDIGSSDKDILKAYPLRFSLFFFKEDGVFRLYGDDPKNFKKDLFDETVQLIGVDTVIGFQNSIIALCNQGIVQITESGVNIISDDIKDKILPILKYANVADIAFSISDETERLYILCLPKTAVDTSAKIAYVYNSTYSTWTTWDIDFTAAIKHPSQTIDCIYFGKTSNSYVYKQRKNRLVTDYRDEEFSMNIVSSSELSITVDNVLNVVVGRFIFQNNKWARIEAINGFVLTVDVKKNWVVGVAYIDVPIRYTVELAPQHFGDPSIVKQAREIELMFSKPGKQTFKVSCASDFSASYENQDVQTLDNPGFGAFPFGGIPFGGGAASVQTIRMLIPPEKQQGHYQKLILDSRDAFTPAGLIGINYVWIPMSEVFT